MRALLTIILAAVCFVLGAAYQADQTPTTDYQVNAFEDSIVVFDQGRYVGSLLYKDVPALDSLITDDNQ